MKPCSRCGETKPAAEFWPDRTKASGLKSQCKDCGREGKRAWKARNPERDREHWRRWRAKQPEGILSYQREWHERQDPERLRRQRWEWKRANPEKVRESNRRSYAANIEQERLRSREHQHRRRIAKGMVSPGTMEFALGLLNQPCVYCAGTDNIEIDHIIPLSRGGKHEPENLAPACRFCNRSKGAKLLSEWGVV